MTASPGLSELDDGYVYRFSAMGSPCEMRIESQDRILATKLAQVVEAEATRIEQKYSRYRPESVLSQINGADGAATVLDDETAGLIDYADQCYRLSGGLFDITSGVLRRIWRFDGSNNVPTRQQVAQILRFIGWHKVSWQRPNLVLPRGMELDLGGIAKEYAVDLALLKASALTDAPILVNFGGDLRVSGPRLGGKRWRALIDDIDSVGRAEGAIEILSGALTTSGDARRFLIKDGIRYSHILNPKTGWPVTGAPRSVTIAAPTCIEAGFLSTLAMLQGKQAEAFVKRENLVAWWVR